MAEKSNKKTSILIVEDEGIVAKDIQTTLKSLGYLCPAITSNGKDAIKKAVELSPDLVLMDIGLEGDIDGIKAAKKIRERGVPVIYLTAYSDETTLQRAKLTEPFGYVLKPFEERELYTAIEMALYKHRMESRLRELKDFSENIVRSMPLGVLVVDLKKRITEINRTQEELVGVGKNDALGKMLFADYMAGLDDSVGPLLDRALKEGSFAQIGGVEYRNEGLGTQSILDISISGLSSGDEITGAVMIIRDATEKRMLDDRMRMLEHREMSLTDKDKTVFYGLVKHPELNDIELSGVLGIKRSTLTGIRNKLHRSGYYTTMRMPNLPALGFEMVTFKYGRLVKTAENKADPVLHNEELTCPGFVHIISTSGEYFSANVCQSITDYKKATDPIEAGYERLGIHRDLTTIQFPFGICTVKHFYDYSRAIASWFGLGVERKPEKPQWEDKRSCRISDNEAKVLYALTRYPDYTDREIAKKVGLNKITVNQIKKRLMDNGLIQTFRVPNLQKMGCELMLVMHARFNPQIDPKVRAKMLGCEFPTSSTHIEGMREALMVCPFKSYLEYKTMYDQCLKVQNENELFLEDPKCLLFPLNKMRVNRVDFASVIKDKFELGDI